MSKDYSSNPEAVYSDIKKLVTHVWNHTEFSKPPVAKGLAPSEVAYILSSDLSYRERQFLFEIAQKARSRGTPSNATTRLVTLPRNWMVKIASHGTYRRYLDKLCGMGILEPRLPYSTISNRAKTYAVIFPFNEEGHIGTLDGPTICLFLSKDQIKKRYPDYTARKILSEGNPVDGPPYKDVQFEMPDPDTRPDVLGFDSNGQEIRRHFSDQSEAIRKVWELSIRLHDEQRKGS